MLAKTELKPVFDVLATKHDTYEIVDGQQRLTSLILFLMAIQAKIGPYRPAIAEAIRSTYARKQLLQEPGLNASVQFIYPLTLNSFCQDFFTSSIVDPSFGNNNTLSQPLRTSHKRLKDTYDYFVGYIDRTKNTLSTIDQFQSWLINLYSVIANKLKFTEETVEGMLEAGVIFETMNNRGKPISEMDKIKNSLLYLASKTAPSDTLLPSLVEKCWEEVLNTLMTAGFHETRHEDQLLRANWLYSQNENAKEWKGIDSFKSSFNLTDYKSNKNDLYKRLCEYVRQLKESAVAFCDVLAPDRAGAFEGFLKNGTKIEVEVREWSTRFSRLNVPSNFLPLLMAARLKSTPEDYLTLIQLCEKMAFRTYVLKGSRSHAGAARLYRLSSSVFKGEKIETVSRELEYIALSTCDNEGVANAFKPNIVRRDWFQWKGIRYFLFEYERARQGEDALRPMVSWDSLESNSIEHILPQDASDKYWKDRFKRKITHETFLNDLGNLTLSSAADNAFYSHSSFPVKKGSPSQTTPCYCNSNFRMTRDLASGGDEWDKGAIRLRRETFANWALTRWHIDFEADGDVVIGDDPDIEEDYDEDT